MLKEKFYFWRCHKKEDYKKDFCYLDCSFGNIRFGKFADRCCGRFG